MVYAARTKSESKSIGRRRGLGPRSWGFEPLLSDQKIRLRKKKDETYTGGHGDQAGSKPVG